MKAYLGHFEIPARDPERSAEFFAAVLGWRAEPVDWPGAAYLELRAPDAPRAAAQGGLLAAESAGFDRPLPVIHLSEGTLESCLERIEAAGGSIAAPPRAVGEMGRFERFRDPDGHQWGVWSSAG